MINPPQVRSEEPTAVTPHGGFCGGEGQQWLSYPTISACTDLDEGRSAMTVPTALQVEFFSV